jgi:hypothetical protein
MADEHLLVYVFLQICWRVNVLEPLGASMPFKRTASPAGGLKVKIVLVLRGLSLLQG